MSIRNLAENLNIQTKTLQRLIQSVVVTLDKSRESANKLSQKLDLGLNFINKKGWKVVPEMARCYYTGDNNQLDTYQFLNGIELTS